MQSEAVSSGLGVKSFIYRWNYKKVESLTLKNLKNEMNNSDQNQVQCLYLFVSRSAYCGI